MTAATRYAAALDDLLRAGHRPNTRRLAPPGWADQAATAAAQLRTGWHRLAACADVTTAALDITDTPRWLSLQINATLCRWAADETTTCQHAPTAAHPQPVHAAAWRPDLVVCRRCVHLLHLPRRSPANRTCDACGHTYPDPGDITGGFVIADLLVFSYGVCRGCNWMPTTSGRPAA